MRGCLRGELGRDHELFFEKYFTDSETGELARSMASPPLQLDRPAYALYERWKKEFKDKAPDLCFAYAVGEDGVGGMLIIGWDEKDVRTIVEEDQAARRKADEVSAAYDGARERLEGASD